MFLNLIYLISQSTYYQILPDFLSQLNSWRHGTRRPHEVASVALVAAMKRHSNNAADNRVASVRALDLRNLGTRCHCVDGSDSLAT